MPKITLSTADMHRIAKVAKETGTVFEVIDGEMTLRFIPVEGADPQKPTTRLNKVDEILSRGNRKDGPRAIETPLNGRERSAMRILSGFPAGERHHWDEIPNCGFDTEQRLLARGYVGIDYTTFEIWPTEKGLLEWAAQSK